MSILVITLFLAIALICKCLENIKLKKEIKRLNDERDELKEYEAWQAEDADYYHHIDEEM